MRGIAAAVIPLWAFATLGALADEVYLKDGAMLVGTVEERGDDVLVTRGENTVRIPRSMVRKIVYAPLPEEIYEKRKAELDADDLEGHLELARWCVRQRLAGQADEAWRKVVELDPENAEARRALGHVRLEEGRWATEDEAMARKGLVRHEGKWVTAAERDAALANAAEEERVKEARRRVRRALNDLGSGSEKRRTEAARVLAEFRWSDKLPLYLDALTGETTPIRRHVAAELGDCADPSAATKLVRTWLADGDEEVRRSAELSLKRLNAPEATLTPLLRAALGDRNDVRQRALEALKEVKDPRIGRYLIDLWEHNLAEVSIAFARDPGTQREVLERKRVMPDGTEMTMPRRLVPRHPMPEVEKKLHDREREIVAAENATIREILRGLAGEDFGADLGRWNAWARTHGAKPKTDK
jgi:hypothetical protein